MIRAYLYALDPTDAQAQEFQPHCGAQRYAYNVGLTLVKTNLDQRAAERSYGIPDDQLTPAVSWSAGRRGAGGTWRCPWNCQTQHR